MQGTHSGDLPPSKAQILAQVCTPYKQFVIKYWHCITPCGNATALHTAWQKGISHRYPPISGYKSINRPMCVHTCKRNARICQYLGSQFNFST